jgi:hypothetical protein
LQPKKDPLGLFKGDYIMFLEMEVPEAWNKCEFLPFGCLWKNILSLQGQRSYIQLIKD